MADFTDYLEGQIANWMANGTQMDTPPSNPHVALHTADPTDTGSDGEVDTATTSYERQSTTAGGDWTITGGSLENTAEVTFPQAAESWGTITHATLWAGPTDTDDAYAIMELSTSRTIETDDQLRFAAGNLSFSID